MLSMIIYCWSKNNLVYNCFAMLTKMPSEPDDWFWMIILYKQFIFFFQSYHTYGKVCLNQIDYHKHVFWWFIFFFGFFFLHIKMYRQAWSIMQHLYLGLKFKRQISKSLKFKRLNTSNEKITTCEWLGTSIFLSRKLLITPGERETI